MDIEIHAKNIELNDQAHKYIQRKFQRLERHLRPLSDAKLEVSRTSARSQGDRVVAQLTLTASRSTLRGQERGPNLFAAIDAVVNVLDRQIERYKARAYTNQRARKAGEAGSVSGLEQAVVESSAARRQEGQEPPAVRVVRTKRFPMKPTSVEDAIMEMELLSHDFFLFYNIDSKQYNVVYHRSDGDYGVIEPEPA